ncbi:MAG: bifunctional glycosyltransferase family 2/GtrA family protein, partial [Clostridia bacterium]|nr:bifunctional glycosyltransferase family 2/GtrA family protein [Clostridia bacterium]
NVVVLIPAYNPDKLMVKYITGLHESGINNIVVVDDGSREETKCYFEEIKSIEGVRIVTHAVNQGKGRALKTGFNYVLNEYVGENKKVGVVTADSDGQHSIEDTIKCAKKLIETEALVLGTRDFSDKNVPFKSSFGNRCTTFVFNLLYGKWINDTQTGLRGIPYEYMKECMKLKGERFEYEILMLIDAVNNKHEIVEETIETIYIDINRATNFNAVWDSIRIYSVIFGMFFKFVLVSLLSFVLDIVAFAILSKMVFENLNVATATLAATIVARVVSSAFNYNMNKNVVFKSDNNSNTTVFKYYALCVVQMFVSWLLVVNAYELIGFDTTVLKVVVDTVLFLVSYQIQRRWIFKKSDEEKLVNKTIIENNITI